MFFSPFFYLVAVGVIELLTVGRNTNTGRLRDDLLICDELQRMTRYHDRSSSSPLNE